MKTTPVASQHRKWRQLQKRGVYGNVFLTPTGRLVTAPEFFSLAQTNSRWALLEHEYDDQIAIISRRGQLYALDLSEYEKCRALCLGKQSLLIAHSSISECFLSLVNLEPAPMHCYWRSRVAAFGFGTYIVNAIWDKTDVFVIVFAPESVFWGILLVDAQGKFWHPPIFWGGFDCEASPVVKKECNQVVVDLRKQVSSPLPNPMVIRMLDGQGYIDLEPGISISGPLASFQSDQDDLWDYMLPPLKICLLEMPKHEPAP